MKDYTKLITDLRRCQFGYCLCPECSYYGQKGAWDDDDLADCDDKMHLDAAAAIEELMAQVKDKDCLIQQQADEIESLRRDVKKQQEKMIELAKKLPKRGEWIHGRELGKEWLYDHWVTYFEDWRCSNCGVVFEQESKPKYHYCPNCGAKMKGEKGEEK